MEINKKTVKHILHHELNITKVFVKKVPKKIYKEKKENRKNTALISWNGSQKKQTSSPKVII